MNKGQYKRIGILGAGESGNGAALLARAEGYSVFVSDKGTIQPRYKEELRQAGIDFEENGHTLECLSESDLIIKSPGIPRETEVVRYLKAEHKEIISEVEWAFRFKGNSRIIAITGTNGKSTTTSLVFHLLKRAGMDVSIVGNIGFSFARQVAQAPSSWYVIELSSFQLDDTVSFRPDIGVLLNISPDHLDRYDYKLSRYVASKFRIAAFQESTDLFIVNVDDPEINTYLKHNQLKPKIAQISMNENNITQEDGAFMKDEDLQFRYNGATGNLSIHDLTIKGKHNLYNSMAAGISALAAGIRKEKFRDCFSTFEGLEHRLEFVATVRGVDFINDSKGTNLNSVWFALESMKKPVVLILGGQDKGNDYNEIRELVREKVHAIVCMGLNNEPILKALGDEVDHIVETGSAADAVHAAYTLADTGDVVLLSPGCASFDLFKNYEDRGSQFKAAVRSL